MSYFFLFTAIAASSFLLIATIAFLKAKDVFVMTHIVMIANCYVIPSLLIAIELTKFSWLSFVKIMVIIILNLVVNNLLCYAILRRAMINKIIPDAEIINF